MRALFEPSMMSNIILIVPRIVGCCLLILKKHNIYAVKMDWLPDWVKINDDFQMKWYTDPRQFFGGNNIWERKDLIIHTHCSLSFLLHCFIVSYHFNSLNIPIKKNDTILFTKCFNRFETKNTVYNESMNVEAHYNVNLNIYCSGNE